MQLVPLDIDLKLLLSSYSEFMTDNSGNWLYSDRRDIEKDLGMTLEEYDILSEFRTTVRGLTELNIVEHSNFSARETLALQIIKKLKAAKCEIS